MRFGLSFLPDDEGDNKDAATYFRDALALCDLGDREGLAYVKMTQHYLHGYGGYCPSPLGFLAAVAARTQRIRLMTGCVLPVFNHPIKLASEIAMVDAISNGRLDVGMARAYLPSEFQALEVPLDESRARFWATVLSVRELLSKTDVSCDTPFFKFSNVSILPRPVQPGGPPLWGAAVRTEESFVQLGQQGLNLLITLGFTPMETLRHQIGIYRRAFNEAHPTKTPRVAISLPLFVHGSQKHAESRADFFLQRYLDVWAKAVDSWNGVSSRDYVGYSDMSYWLRSQKPAAIRAMDNAVVGEPQAVIEQTVMLREQLGVEDILWQVDYGAMPLTEAEASVRLFIDQVMPHLS